MANRTPLVISGNSLQALQAGDSLYGSSIEQTSLPYSSLTIRPVRYPLTDIMYPVLHHGNTSSVFTSASASFLYFGQLTTDFTANYVSFYVSGAGTGTQTAEVGIFSSSAEPTGATLLTKIVASGSVDSLTSTGKKSNTSAFGATLTAGTHVWAAVRVVMGTTQPSTYRGAADNAARGLFLAASPGALTSVTTVTPTTFVGTQAPNMVISS